MINQKDKEKLTGSLLRMFGYAEADALRESSFEPIPGKDETSEAEPASQKNETKLPDKSFDVLTKCKESFSSDELIAATSDQPIAPKGQIRTPQACAFLLATGQIVGGVAKNPLSSANPDGENAIKIAFDEYNSASRVGRVEGDRIIAAAIIKIEGQESEYAQDRLADVFSKAGIKGLIWVDPKTGKSEYSAHPFPISTPECA